MASNSDAKKAVYDAVYNAAMAGKPISQGAANKIYDEVVGTAKKTTVPTNAAYNQINARTGKNPLENNAVLDILKEQTAATTSSPFSAMFNKSAQNANDELRKAGIYAPEFLTIEDFKTTQQKQADAQKAYDDYVNSDTYKNKQAAGATDTSALFSDNVPSQRKVYDEKEAELRALKDYYEVQMQKEKDQQVMDANLQEIADLSEEDRKNLEQYVLDRDNYTREPLEDSVSENFASIDFLANPLIDKLGKEKVQQLAEAYTRNQNAATMQGVEELAKKHANEKPVLGGLGSYFTTVPAKLVSPLASLSQQGIDYARSTGQFSTLDPNSKGNVLDVYADTVRSEVAGNISGDEETTNFLRQLASTAYQGSMSIADSTARLIASGGKSGIASAIAATGAFSNGLRQYSQLGASPEQAAGMALVDAGLEYITEKIPTEQVLDMFKKGDNTSAVKNVLKQAFLVEPTSEEVNLFAGVAAEALILGDKSSNNQRLGELIANGMSYEEAKAQIYKELWKEAAQTYAVSAFSGGLSAAGATIAGDVANRPRQEVKQQAEAAAPLRQEAKSAEDVLAEMTAADLAQNAPAPAPAQPMTENQQHLENGIAATMGVEQEKAAANEPIATQAQEQEAQTTEDAESVKENLWKNYRGKQDKDARVSDGWQAVADNSVWATALAMKEVNPEYYNAYMAAADSEQLSPLIDAVINAANDVRQESVSPMAAATVINEVFEQYGAAGLRQMYNSAGNLYDNVLNRMKDVDAEQNANAVKGIGAAEQDFSGKAQYQDLLYEGNVQPDRATDVRPMEVPKTDVHGDNVSQTAANVYGSKITSDELASLMEVPIAQGDFSYMPISNDQATEMALDTIAHAGNWTNAYSKWKEQVVKGNAGAEMSARGALLLNKAAKDGNKEEWLDTLRYMQKLGTNTAQGLQAMRLIRELTPPDKIVFMEAIVNDLSESYGMQNELQINPKLVNDFNNAKTDKDRDAVINEIQIDIAKQIPSTFLDKWTALRYTNMLGNLKTQVRNLAGNVGSMAVYRMKDAIATGMEAVANKVSGGKVERTKSFTVSKELRKACSDYFNQDKLAVTDGGKFGERLSAKGQFEQGIQDQRVIFKSNAQNPTLKKVGDIALAPMEGYRRATNWMMNNEYFGDEAFGRVAYVRAMAGYLKAHGVNGSDLSKISSNLLNDARRYAVKEAQEATFHDNSELAKIASKIQKSTGVIGQGVMPFTKTPANILTRAVEFSPIGLIDSTVKTVQTVRGKTELTGADIVNSWAKTITGTGLFMLGAALFDQGLLTGGPDEDDEKEQFDAMNGAQNYAITLPDGTSYTIDWLTPAAMPLFMGAQFWKLWASEQDITLAEAGEAFTSIADPMVQMSMLQGLNDTLDGIKYSENNFGQFLLNSSVSYLTQGLTNTLMGQIERSTEENRQTTFVDKDSNVPQWLQKQLGKASQKILGWDYQQTDYRNAWGETEENEGGLLYNLLSPGYLSTEESTAVSDELYRLREATGENVFPKSPEKTLSYTDKDGQKQKKNLTAEEYEAMQKAEGQTAARVLNEVTTSADYAALSDAQKAKVVDHIYDYAREQGRVEAVSDYIGYKDSWMQNISGKEAKTIVNKVVGADLKGAMDAMSNAWANDFDDAESVEALESAYSVYSNMSQAARKAVKDDATGRVAAYMEARNNRIKTETFVDLYKTYWELDKSGKKASEKAQQWAYTLERAHESGKLTEKQKTVMQDALGFGQYLQVEATKFNEMTDAGLTAKAAQDTVKAINNLLPEEGYSQVRDIQNWDAIAAMTISDTEKIAAMKTYMTDKQEEKLDEVLDMGYSVDEYPEIWRIIDSYTSGTGKKKRTIAYMQNKYNISYSSAKKLYEVFK